nr:hypothetical protein Iba_chr08bCG8130 [Ipomoea batatas]
MEGKGSSHFSMGRSVRSSAGSGEMMEIFNMLCYSNGQTTAHVPNDFQNYLYQQKEKRLEQRTPCGDVISARKGHGTREYEFRIEDQASIHVEQGKRNLIITPVTKQPPRQFAQSIGGKPVVGQRTGWNRGGYGNYQGNYRENYQGNYQATTMESYQETSVELSGRKNYQGEEGVVEGFMVVVQSGRIGNRGPRRVATRHKPGIGFFAEPQNCKSGSCLAFWSKKH